MTDAAFNAWMNHVEAYFLPAVMWTAYAFVATYISTHLMRFVVSSIRGEDHD